MQQKTQQELGLGRGATGEAPSAPSREAEAGAARSDVERRAAVGPTMEAIVERNNLRKALAQVRANKGAPGIDGMSFEALASHLKEHWLTIRAQLLDGSYKPVEIPQASGDTRPLGIPTVLDRFIQQALMQVLQAELGPDVLRVELRISAEALGTSGGGQDAGVHRVGPRRGGGPRS